MSSSMKTKVISGLFWKLSERLSAQIISLMVTVVLARVLLPEDYGIVSLVTIFITIANVFVSDGFGVALIQKQDADNVDFSTIFYFSIFLSICAYSILYCLAIPISKFYSMPVLIPVLRVFALRIPIAAVNSVQQAFVSRNMLFRRFFFATLIGTIVSGIVGIIMAYNGFGVWSLVTQYITNAIIDTIVLWETVKWRPDRVFSLSRLKKLFNYGWKLLVQSLLVSVYSNLRSLVIGKVYSSEDLAYYSKGSQFPNLIVVNVDTAISSTLFPAMSKEQKSLERVIRITQKSVQLSSYILSPLLVGLAACSNSFVTLVLTEKWMPIVPYLKIICIGLLFRPAQTATLQAIKSIGRSDIVLKMDIPVRVFGIITLLIAMRYGVLFIAISEVMVSILGLIIYCLCCGRIVGYKISELFKDIAPNIFQSFIMYLVVMRVEEIYILTPFLMLVMQILVGVATYIMISVVLKNKNFYYLLSEVKQVGKKFTIYVSK